MEIPLTKNSVFLAFQHHNHPIRSTGRGAGTDCGNAAAPAGHRTAGIRTILVIGQSAEATKRKIRSDGIAAPGLGQHQIQGPQAIGVDRAETLLAPVAENAHLCRVVVTLDARRGHPAAGQRE